jgi:hypothetical protein
MSDILRTTHKALSDWALRSAVLEKKQHFPNRNAITVGAV